MFGGYATGEINETWTCDGGRSPLQTVMPPSARSEVGLTFNRARGATVVYGSDTLTWELDGTTWTPHELTPSPPTRFGATLAYSDLRQASILFGGQLSSADVTDDTWEYRDGTWREIVATPPPKRGLHCATYDATARKVIVFGGMREVDRAVLGDTWLFGYE